MGWIRGIRETSYYSMPEELRVLTRHEIQKGSMRDTNREKDEQDSVIG